jgi:hypothetical protein
MDAGRSSRPDEAHAVLARDGAYQELAEQATETQRNVAADLEDLRRRIERIEKVFIAVE